MRNASGDLAGDLAGLVTEDASDASLPAVPQPRVGERGIRPVIWRLVVERQCGLTRRSRSPVAGRTPLCTVAL